MRRIQNLTQALKQCIHTRTINTPCHLPDTRIFRMPWKPQWEGTAMDLVASCKELDMLLCTLNLQHHSSLHNVHWM